MSARTVSCPSCGSPNRVEPEQVSRGLEPVCGRCRAHLPVCVAPVEVNDAVFDGEVLGAALPVLLDIWAPWCVPCRSMEPVVAEIASTFAGRLRVARMNVDESPETVTRLRIRGVPTLIIFEDGREVARMIGVRDKDQLLRSLSPVT